MHPGLTAQPRQRIPFNASWHFTGGSVTGKPIDQMVDLPHTWNTRDAQEGIPYYRGEGIYEKTFTPKDGWKGKRVFIRFNGVMTIAKVYLNNKLLGEHRGGYSAFVFELTKKLNFGRQNTLRVIADNKTTLEVLPLFGDFNLYGGIYRPVNLIITSPVCISLLDYASSGIYIKQSEVTNSKAEIEVITKISNGTEKDADLIAFITITAPDKKEIATYTEKIATKSGEHTFCQSFTILQPHLWNGKKDPALYSIKIDLLQNGILSDSKTDIFGLRYFSVDPDKGFFLNGKHLALHGVSRHQDRQDKGSALSYDDHKQDVNLMLEMGVNALRLAHYQQSERMYDLCDSAGIIVWAELPWVGGPGGFFGHTNGYEPTEAFQNNARQQLTELIRQNYNHPSIAMWSIFNEIQNPEDASPVSFIKELNQLAKTEDPTRFTVGASMLDPEEPIHDITDLIAWNRYFGWYYGKPEDIGRFLDETHKAHPDLRIGISEYGAGGSIRQHSRRLRHPNPFGSPHPEEWQSYYHEDHLKAFNNRPYIWGTFIWNMFDFGSAFRREGDHYGINDKGLVTFDRKTKKDAFYFYKANWSDEPFVYITSRRYVFRYDDMTFIKVYSNLPEVTLFVNGKSMGTRIPDTGIALWKDITLQKGNNSIKVEGATGGKTYADYCVFVLDTAFGTRTIAKVFNILQHINFMLIANLALLLVLWYYAWKKKPKQARWKRITLKVFFFTFTLTVILLVVIKVFIDSGLG